MHDLIETIKDETTLLTTSVDSYVYECPTCSKRWRYADPPDMQKVFCNGADFGTKVQLENLILEVGEAMYIQNIPELGTVPTEDELYITDNLDDLGLIELVEDGYELTWLGIDILNQLEQ